MKELIGDYYSQIALLSSLKLKHVDKNDLNAVQEVINEDKDYAILVKGSLSNAVRIGLTLKLRKELIHYLELEKTEKSKDLSLDVITKMLKELKDDIKPIADNSQFIKNVYTKAKPSEKKVSVKKVKEQKTLQLMEKMISRGKKR
jgi:hypothetical protein